MDLPCTRRDDPGCLEHSPSAGISQVSTLSLNSIRLFLGCLYDFVDESSAAGIATHGAAIAMQTDIAVITSAALWCLC